MNKFTLLMSGGFSADLIRTWPLWQQGLFVVTVGLIGVFLVLLLFFFVIDFMQKISTKMTANKEKNDIA